jgi:redox-sensitive bicupin YhaK (pirin superfamily)
VSHTIELGRVGWVQVARGSVTVNGEALRAGDGLAIEEAGELKLVGGSKNADVLLFDMVP